MSRLKIRRPNLGKPVTVRGFAAYLPVFASDASRRHFPRPAQLLKGYLSAVFRSDELVRASIDRARLPSDTAVRVYAAGADPAGADSAGAWIEIYGSKARNRRPPPKFSGARTYSSRIEFSVSDGRWAVVAEREENPYGPNHRTSSAILLVGILSSTLLSLVLILIERRKAQARATEMSLRDELTDLYNRRGFLLFAEERMRLSRRNKTGLWLVCADVDHLKRINDMHGHAEGDKAIVRAADALKAAFRDSDIVARVGGDEFAALVFESDANGREVILERIREKLREETARPSGASGTPEEAAHFEVSLSIGAAFADPKNQEALDALFRRADQELYRAKASRPHRPTQ